MIRLITGYPKGSQNIYSEFMPSVYISLGEQCLYPTLNNILEALFIEISDEIMDELDDEDEVVQEVAQLYADDSVINFSEDGIVDINELKVIACLTEMRLFYIVDGVPYNHPQVSL